MIKYTASHHPICKYIYIYILCIFLCALSLFIRQPNYEEKTYRNEDAVYHVLLTMKAYDETPVSEHHFLPLVSLGGEDNKDISWGATVADEKGNYYYTSFSSAGFIAPYVFTKLFHLPISESSLYIFNSFLFIGSLLVLAGLMIRLFNGKLPTPHICLFTAILYLFTPEIMHSQGVIYWHQSLFQLMFFIQLYMYQCFRESGSKKTFALFAILCVINPYVEWSGFVSNIGFFVAELLFSIETKDSKRYIPLSRVVSASIIVVATFVAAGLFSWHFLSVIPADDFWKALVNRFFSRSIGTSRFSSLIKGYCTSFGMSLLIALIGIIFVITKDKQTRSKAYSVLKPTLPVLFVSIFVMLENVLMLGHAISYSFDRMKLIVPLTILLLTIVCTFEKKRTVSIAISIASLILIVCNSTFYTNSRSLYSQNAEYLASNREFAKEVLSEYHRKDTLFTQWGCATRGYTNLLWDGGVYEGVSIEEAKPIAERRGKRYIASLDSINHWWNMYEYTECEIFDMLTGESTVVYSKK